MYSNGSGNRIRDAMMERLTRLIRQLPIKWKLMLGATALIFLLFATYNFSQYLVLKQWMMNQEKDKIQVSMTQLQDYLLEKSNTMDALLITEARPYIEKMIGKNQLVRIIGNNGEPLLTVSNHFDESWVTPRTVTASELLDTIRQEDHILIYRSPFITAKFVGTLEFASNLETFDHFSKTLFWVMLIGGVLAVFISAISGLAIAKQLMRPIRALAATIRSVKEKGLIERVSNIENGDELSSLAQLFNELMNQLEVSFRQQKQFVEDASHELRTPITILEGHLSLLNRWGKSDPEVLNESLQASLQETRRLKGIVEELLTLTRVETHLDSEISEPIPIEPVILETLKRFEVLNPDFEFQVNTEKMSDALVSISPLHLEQIFLIVLDNSVKYSTQDRRIVIEGLRLINQVHITIEDHGIGIPQAELPYVFDRFYRVDKARNREIAGTGLGLSIAKQFVHKYQGEITIRSKENEGTIVLITLPINQIIK
ncbi:HAMP domain-containing histidine kinase [Paenibacillus sp. Soil724D2]|uniref:HAMP domain-containing sensor histidine kinase n=1 Tax=Paenibacillus sp. (strain Soil724D2) TaxID=1736392 RepID=UPI0012E39FE8|nr:HAMP domain-containing histidine kinase [Paenibacillus sp. Soil724D2]